jgi:hypothetical protein
MTHYVLIDGVLQKGNAATQNWARRAAQGVPLDTEEKPDVLALPEDRRSDYQIIEELEETE